jgi:hypothetical protein
VSSLKCLTLLSLAAVLSVGMPSALASADDTVASLSSQLMPEAQSGASVHTSLNSGEGLGARIFSKTDLIWTGQLNGPSLDRPFGTNYNAFQQNYGPMYVYHTLDTIHHFDSTNNVGLELSAKQDFGHAVPGRDGFMVEPGFTLNDPQFWFRHNGVIETSWLKIDAALNVFPGLTSYSREQDYMLFSTALDGTYHIKLPDYRWNAYFSTRVRPTFYSLGGQTPYWKHEQLFLSTGHFVGYHFTDNYELTSSSALDLNYYADGSGRFIRGDGYDDRTQLEFNYYTSNGLIRVGAYVQSLIAEPRLETSSVGIDLTINFLTAKSL